VNTAENVIPLAVPDEDIVRLAPGEYSAIYVCHKGMRIFGITKLRVDFRLLAHPGIVLPRWYRVNDYRGGRIQAGKQSDIVREVSRVLGRRVRIDRIAVSDLANMPVKVLVRTVTKNSRQRPIGQVNHYSTIEELLERET
jgi:hypothetical protein